MEPKNIELKRWIEGRNVNLDAATQYLRRHSEFEGHHERGKKNRTYIDNYAAALLEEVYPPAKPTVIIKGVPQEEVDELRLALDRAQERNDHLLDKVLTLNNEIQKALKQSNNNEILLLESNRHNLKLEETISEIRDEKMKLQTDNTNLNKESDKIKEENLKLKEELESLKNRSLWQRILNR